MYKRHTPFSKKNIRFQKDSVSVNAQVFSAFTHGCAGEVLCNVHLEIVDNFKHSFYIIIMKFTVEKLPQVEAEIDSLEQSQKNMLEADYTKIQELGIEFVRVKPIQKDIFEIKTNELRSLFKYKAGKIVVIGVVFVKKTQKTPKEKIKLAKNRLKEV